MRNTRILLRLLAFLCLVRCGPGQANYDLLLQGGRVVDARNGINDVRDIAIKDGRGAAVEPHIDPALAVKAVNVAGLYVTPGLIDIHVHVFAGGELGSYAGEHSVYPDGFTFRAGVTTVADAGSSGWRTFEEFKARIIDRLKTRVLAFLNIVGNADVAVLRVETGKYGFTDMYGAKLEGNQKLLCELTVRNGKVVYDLNGITRPDWDKLPKNYLQTGDARWDAVSPARRSTARPVQK
jgi:predicted amidohydrolase